MNSFSQGHVLYVDTNQVIKGVVTESDLFLEYLKVQDKISEIEKD